MKIHQLRVCPCPDLLPPGFYWYGNRRRSPGRIPRWVDRFLSETKSSPADDGGHTHQHQELDYVDADPDADLDAGFDADHDADRDAVTDAEMSTSS